MIRLIHSAKHQRLNAIGRSLFNGSSRFGGDIEKYDALVNESRGVFMVSFGDSGGVARVYEGEGVFGEACNDNVGLFDGCKHTGFGRVECDGYYVTVYEGVRDITFRRECRDLDLVVKVIHEKATYKPNLVD